MREFNRKARLAVCLTALLAAGCRTDTFDPEMQSTTDQCKRQELFMACMGALPEGPDETKYNDWDEVVSECNSVARYQSLRPKKYVPEQCRPGS